MNRLTRSNEIQRVRQTGKSFAHPLLVFVVKPNQQVVNRVCVIAGKGLGGAVVRNRAKRQLRAAIDPLLPGLKTGFDLVIIARKEMTSALYNRLDAALKRIVKNADLYQV